MYYMWGTVYVIHVVYPTHELQYWYNTGEPDTCVTHMFYTYNTHINTAYVLITYVAQLDMYKAVVWST